MIASNYSVRERGVATREAAPGEIAYPPNAVFPPDYDSTDLPPFLDDTEAMASLRVTRAGLRELVRLGRLRWAVEFAGAGGVLQPRVEPPPGACAVAPAPQLAPRPRRFAEAKHLYAVEIVGVGTKVGVTKNPRSRITNHVASARRHGRSIGRVWVSFMHAEAESNERRLVTRRGVRGSEYLRASFDTVLRRIEALPMSRATRD